MPWRRVIVEVAPWEVLGVSVVDGFATDRPRHDRLVVTLTVLAVLLVIGLPGVLARWDWPTTGLGPGEVAGPTQAARRVLAELPGAYQAHGLVVVPAATDPYTTLAGVTQEDRVTGQVVGLGVHAVTPYVQPAAADAPDWLTALGAVDAVVSDLGELSFACLRPPGSDRCVGSFVVEHRDHLFVVGRPIGDHTSTATARFTGLSTDGLVTVLVGWLPPAATSVTAEDYGRDGGEIAVSTAEITPDGAGIWWLASFGAITTVEFRDRTGASVSHRTLGG